MGKGCGLARNRTPLTQRARGLRQSQTEAEKRLWSRLRNRQLEGFKFRRQIPLGPYIADFACPDRKLIVELDGGQHATQMATDEQRTQALEREGYRVMRFWNDQLLLETDAVLEVIRLALLTPHPNPLPSKGRGNKPL
ncbi:MAG: endonuclease domain-containing protein [Panacagrimonas sp.]